MTGDEYDKALRLGQKEYRAQVSRGSHPYLPVLDDILSHIDIETRTDLGLIDIPLELIVGTSTEGRTTAFASNFMPLLNAKTEFAHKWILLSEDLPIEGQREPIKAYEFLNRYYVVEGNKRVSVAKYYDNVSLYGYVTRVVPKKTDDKEVLIYYDYIDFYNITEINYIWMSKVGSFQKLLKLTSKHPGEVWDKDERSFFRSCYLAFKKEFIKAGGGRLKITPAEAMLSYIIIYGYETIIDVTAAELRKNITKIWDEFLMLEEDESIALVMQPQEEVKKNIITKIISPGQSKLRAAFVYDKPASESAWTYAHELGRLHVANVFKDSLETCYVDGIDPTDEKASMEALEAVIADGYDVIFTTTPQLLSACLKTAVAYPDAKILNCSLNTSHQYIRTYYSRMYEAKFVAGALAGALAENDKIGYIADYPIYGMAANINAFALGAKLVNPRAKVYLEWSTVKDRDIDKAFKDEGITLISHKEMITPQNSSREYGLYYQNGSDAPINICMPVWDWGVLYEKLIRSIMSGTWKAEASSSNQALNYWWGMSAGVIDVICSKKLPANTQCLMDLLKKSIISGEFNPFSGALYSQDGIVQTEDKGPLQPIDIIKMEWLNENIIGSIPKLDELKDEAREIVKLQGLIGQDKKLSSVLTV